MSKDLDFLKKHIVDSYLVSYGIKLQFLQLEFNNEQYEEIVISIDCNINCDSLEISKLVSPFSELSEDTFELAYFIPLNNKKVTNCNIKGNSIFLKFDDGIEIEFDLSKDGSDVGFNFKERRKNNRVTFSIDHNSFVN
ncbi:MAG: hypothetical protein Pars93KO_26790 [Parasphingorhabdus sp.]